MLAFLAEKAASRIREEERESRELLHWRRQAAIQLDHLPNPDRREQRNVEEDRRAERDSVFPRFRYKE